MRKKLEEIKIFFISNLKKKKLYWQVSNTAELKREKNK